MSSWVSLVHVLVGCGGESISWSMAIGFGVVGKNYCLKRSTFVSGLSTSSPAAL
jgi:hypothetical protein